MRKKKPIIKIAAVTLLSVVLVFSGWQLIKVSGDYAQADDYYQEMQQYKPTPPAEQAEQPEVEIDIVNQSVIDLKERYPDTVGWLTINGTTIDYPFVQAQDNETYLHRDMDLNYLYSGTVFMDYRCAADYSDDVTVLYGHRMKNNTMFAPIKEFRDKAFFDENKDGYIYLTNHTYRLEIAALLVVKSTDREIYRFGQNSEANKLEFIEYVVANAIQYRELGLSAQDRFVALSTCTTDFDNARMVLVARLADSTDTISEPSAEEQVDEK